MNSQLFKHFTPIQLRFKDYDALQHVNNANYLTYIESARTDYIEAVLKNEIDWAETSMILARAEVNFKLPVLLNEKIGVRTRCSRLGSKSFDLAYSVVRLKDGKEDEVANALTVMVCFNYQRNETIPVPQKWKEIFMAFEGESLAL